MSVVVFWEGKGNEEREMSENQGRISRVGVRK